ncbi:MAG: hypothetical protein GY828_01970 [Candidatus Gracilibacteria bacterium]|nr:hypothetical protein [Candidatus Gracilibacteria bacterium]
MTVSIIYIEINFKEIFFRNSAGEVLRYPVIDANSSNNINTVNSDSLFNVCNLGINKFSKKINLPFVLIIGYSCLVKDETIELLTNFMKVFKTFNKINHIYLLNKNIGSFYDVTINDKLDIINKDFCNNEILIVNVNYNSIEAIMFDDGTENILIQKTSTIGINDIFFETVLKNENSLLALELFGMSNKELSFIINNWCIEFSNNTVDLKEYKKSFKINISKYVSKFILENYKRISDDMFFIITGNIFQVMNIDQFYILDSTYSKRIYYNEKSKSSNFEGFSKIVRRIECEKKFINPLISQSV